MSELELPRDAANDHSRIDDDWFELRGMRCCTPFYIVVRHEIATRSVATKSRADLRAFSVAYHYRKQMEQQLALRSDT